MSGCGKHISEVIPPRPAGATHRMIPALYVEFGPLPDEDPRSSTALFVRLDRSGMPAGSKGGGNGRPRPPVQRTIDARVGDQLLSGGRWRVIRAIRAYGSNWLTDAEAKRCVSDGYIYRLAD